MSYSDPFKDTPENRKTMQESAKTLADMKGIVYIVERDRASGLLGVIPKCMFNPDRKEIIFEISGEGQKAADARFEKMMERIRKQCDEMEQERWRWEESVWARWASVARDAGFGGDPQRLWDAMIAAREECLTSLTAAEIADHPERFDTFSASLRSHFGSPLSALVIKLALLAKPRWCPLCENECWDWCDHCIVMIRNLRDRRKFCLSGLG
jgi:hypothetical protein